MSLVFSALLAGASFALRPVDAFGREFREPEDQTFERPILAFNDHKRLCVLRFREKTSFEQWHQPGFKPRWFRLVSWTSCQKLRFRDVLKADYAGERITPDSDATFDDVRGNEQLVSISGEGTEVVLFFDVENRMREIWVSD